MKKEKGEKNLVVEAENLHKKYSMRNNEIKALDGVSLSIPCGNFVVILGYSGSGKTTLLNALGAITNVDAGTIRVNGKLLQTMNEKEKDIYRRDSLGFIFQEYNLISDLTSYENIALAASLSKRSISVEKALEQVGMQSRAHHYPSQLSGGEQQRIAIARVLVKQADLLLCDEPTGALDTDTGVQILKLLYSISKENKTVIVVTHNQLIANMADLVITMKNGKIFSQVKNHQPMWVEDIQW